jgi:hypothetical protein
VLDKPRMFPVADGDIDYEPTPSTSVAALASRGAFPSWR